jgi:hypothetical protein
MTGSAQSTVCVVCTANHRCATLKYGRAGTAVRRLHGGRVRRSPSDPPTLGRSEPRAPRPRDLGPRAGSPPRAFLLAVQRVCWVLGGQVAPPRWSEGYWMVGISAYGALDADIRGRGLSDTRVAPET